MIWHCCVGEILVSFCISLLKVHPSPSKLPDATRSTETGEKPESLVLYIVKFAVVPIG